MPLPCPGTVVGKLLCELKSPGKLVSAALHLYSPVVLLRWISPGMCRPDGLAGSHRPYLELDLAQCFFKSCLDQLVWPQLAALHRVLDGFSAFALFISPKKKLCLLSVGLSARGGFSEQPSCTHHCVCGSLNIASFPMWFLEVLTLGSWSVCIGLSSCIVLLYC